MVAPKVLVAEDKPTEFSCSNTCKTCTHKFGLVEIFI